MSSSLPYIMVSDFHDKVGDGKLVHHKIGDEMIYCLYDNGTICIDSVASISGQCHCLLRGMYPVVPVTSPPSWRETWRRELQTGQTVISTAPPSLTYQFIMDLLGVRLNGEGQVTIKYTYELV